MSLGSAATTVGFWTGTLLPFLYLPVFVVGVEEMRWFALFVGLLVINVIALVVGHDYPATRTR